MKTKKELEMLYLKAKEFYYNGLTPIMTDSEFDELENNLKEMKSDVVNIVGSPVGNYTVKHLSPMLSLKKIQAAEENFPKEELDKFIESSSNTALKLTPKLDGSSCNLIYYNGNLLVAATRGNKEYGTDITKHMKKIVPNNIYYRGLLEIRGEVVMKKSIFATKFSEVAKNTRNLVAGILGRDEETDDIQYCDFVAFEFRKFRSDNYVSSKDFSFLKQYGFKIPFHIDFDEYDFSKFLDAYRSCRDLRQDYEYDLDGLVLDCCNIDAREKLGDNGVYPKYAIAIKFPPERTTTSIVGITWQIGSTRRYTPVANLKPIKLSGSTVSNVTLNNYAYLRDNGIGIGSEITLIKSGDIIPKVDKVITTSTNIAIPTQCEHCNAQLKVESVHLICPNTECSSILFFDIMSTIRTLNIKTVGDAQVKTLIKTGLIKNFFDIFDSNILNKKNLIESGMFKEGKSLDNLIKSLVCKEITISQVIQCCNFDNVGKSIANAIENTFYGIKDFSGLNRSVIDNILEEGTPENTKFHAALKFFQDAGSLKVKLKKDTEKEVLYLELTGSPKEFGYSDKALFLKECQKYTSKQLMLGGLGKDAKILVTDDLNSNSAKMQKAKKLNCRIILYSDFISYLKDNI